MPPGNMELKKDTLSLACENTSHKRATGVYKLWFHGNTEAWAHLRECVSQSGDAAVLQESGVQISGKIVQISAKDLDWFVLFQPD